MTINQFLGVLLGGMTLFISSLLCSVSKEIHNLLDT